MGALDRPKKVGNSVRKGWRSTDPDRYSHYKRGRERQPKEAARGRGHADRSAELEREEAQRGQYEKRYAAERAAEDPQTEAPRDDKGKTK
jgi:hypothetical protein